MFLLVAWKFCISWKNISVEKMTPVFKFVIRNRNGHWISQKCCDLNFIEDVLSKNRWCKIEWNEWNFNFLFWKMEFQKVSPEFSDRAYKVSWPGLAYLSIFENLKHVTYWRKISKQFSKQFHQQIFQHEQNCKRSPFHVQVRFFSEILVALDTEIWFTYLLYSFIFGRPLIKFS